MMENLISKRNLTEHTLDLNRSSDQSTPADSRPLFSPVARAIPPFQSALRL